MIHLRHSIDGYPLCWPMDQEGEFEGTFKDDEVTCLECLKLMKED